LLWATFTLLFLTHLSGTVILIWIKNCPNFFSPLVTQTIVFISTFIAEKNEKVIYLTSLGFRILGVQPVWTILTTTSSPHFRNDILISNAGRKFNTLLLTNISFTHNCIRMKRRTKRTKTPTTFLPVWS
jgi:hypothetical protein